MDTQRSSRLLRGAFAVAIVMGVMTATGTARANGPHEADTPAVSPHQGPGAGSVKTPPFYDAAYQAYVNRRHDARQLPPQRQGLGSVKAPGIH